MRTRPVKPYYFDIPASRDPDGIRRRPRFATKTEAKAAVARIMEEQNATQPYEELKYRLSLHGKTLYDAGVFLLAHLERDMESVTLQGAL